MVLRKHKLEAQLKDEAQLISSGVLRDENPLDSSEEFASFLEACRGGDLRTCQQMILAGVNINGKDDYDYTPLILVSDVCSEVLVARSPDNVFPGKPVWSLRARRAPPRCR